MISGCSGGAINRPVLKEYGLVTSRAQVTEPNWLASFSSDELHGRLSPDGKRLLYAGNQKGNLDIWIKDLTTGVPHRLTSHVAADTQPAWAPDGQRVVFVSKRDDVKGDIYLWDERGPRRLTGRDNADLFPVFAPREEAVYFASGPEGRSRIVRLDLSTKEETPLSGWGATHPAVSSDGLYLAYTLFDAQGRGRLAVQRLATKEVKVLTTPDYHAGFPTFSPDGRRVVFSRFDSGAPLLPLGSSAVASIWEVDLHRALDATTLRAAQDLARPLTSGRRTGLFAQVTARGLLFTSRRAGSLDIGLLPSRGPVPRLTTPHKQLALALAQQHPKEKLLCLCRVVDQGPSPQASEALYLSSRLHVKQKEFDRARRLQQRLIRESALTHGIFAQLALIDASVLEVEQGRAGSRGSEAVKAAISRLQQLKLPPRPHQRVAAHLLLRMGDMYRAGGKVGQAVDQYEALLRAYSGQQQEAVQAKFFLGSLLSRVHDPTKLTTYYLSLFKDFPRKEEWLRRAVKEVIRLARRPGQDEVERLRAIIEAHPGKALLGAMAQMRMARLYEQQGRLPLAIRALDVVARRYRKVRRESTRAAFELGRLSLAISKRLRQQGRLSEALDSYDRALSAYEMIVRRDDPGTEEHARARTEYLRLSLLEAAQREREGERALAEKRYLRILDFDHTMIQAHRKRIQFGVARGELQRLMQAYSKDLRRDSGDCVAHYSLGYLQTLRRPLSAADLKQAEGHLRRAVGLCPQSPFGHMTLGWVHEMRERYLGQTFQGWLEEAIVLYGRAQNLNDRDVDIQTEADLLLNQCNVFANLGNGWSQAYRFCGQRKALKVPFLSKAREATYHLTFGRAATAMGHHEEAAQELGRALELSRELRRKKLEAEVLTRLALNSQLRGDHEAADRDFARAADLYRAQGLPQVLTGLYRSMAHNLSLQGRPAQALARLAQARQALQQHGVPPQEPMMLIGDPWDTTAPLGFDELDEAYLALAIRGRGHAQQGAWPEALELLKQRIANRQRSLEQRPNAEVEREVVLLHNTAALVRLRRGKEGAFHKDLKRAGALARKVQTKKKEGYAPRQGTFAVQVALALNAAEQVLALLHQAGQSPHLGEVLSRLERLETLRAAAEKGGKRLLSQRLRLALWSDLALLSLRQGLARSRSTPRSRAGARHTPAAKASSADQALSSLLTEAAPFRRAVRLLLRAFQETAGPGRGDQLSTEEARERGVLETLWRPLSSRERRRWHVLLGLNLAEAMAAFTPHGRLAEHASTPLLERLALLGAKQDVGTLRFAVAAELAFRRRDMRAMGAAVRGFLQRSPLLAEPGTLALARQIRGRVMGRAVALALYKKDIQAAVGFAEQEDRRAVADNLVAAGPAGTGRAGSPVRRLMERSRAYQRLLSRPDAGDGPGEVTQEGALNHAEQALAQALAALSKIAPRLAGLFSVPEFPRQDFIRCLAPDDVAITAVEHRGRITLVSLLPGVEPDSVTLGQDLLHLRALARKDPGALQRLLAPTLQRLTRGSKRAYLALERLSLWLPLEAMLPNQEVVRLTSLWELLDAHAVRNLSFAGGLVVHPRAKEAALLAKRLGLSSLAGPALKRKDLDRPFEQAGVLVWSGPLRFDGGSAANVRLLLHDPRRLEDLQLAKVLGFSLRGHLVALLDPRFTPGRARMEKMVLMRLLHAMGIPSVLIPQQRSLSREAAATTLARVKEGLGRQRLSRILKGHRARPGGIALYGHGGLSAETARAFARARLKQTVKAGAAAFNARPRRLAEAVENLESASRMMAFLGDFKYQDGVLLYLANAYTLLKDYGRAVPFMNRLVALRRKKVHAAQQAAAKAAAKTRARAERAILGAQAKLVQAMELMGWLRMRYQQYDAALEVNARAIALYKEVKRPLMARGAFHQRSIIAEEKGDVKQALTYARRSLETARTILSRAKKGKAEQRARGTVVGAASRLAKLQRMRFSDYRAAAAAAEVARAHLPPLKQGKLTRQHLAVMLEIARVDSARGDYSQAVDKASQALKLVKASGLDLQDEPILELVNNLYFLGSYQVALPWAEEGLKQARGKDLRRIQFHNAKGSIYAALGRTPEAVSSLQQALKISRALGNTAEMAASHNNLGNALRLAGELDQARQEFRKALTIDRRREDKLGQAIDYANLGLTEALKGLSTEAARHLDQALRLSRDIGAPMGQLKALLGLGRLDLKGAKPARALARFRRGLKIAAKLGLRNWAWRFHLLAARALRRLERPQDARRELRLGLAMVEDRAPRLRKPPGVLRVEEQPEDLYDELIDLLAEAGEAVAAFDLCERLRSRSFVDMVSQSALRLPLPAARELLDKDARLRVRLEAARSAEMRTRSTGARAAIQQSVKGISSELSTNRARLTALNAWYPGLVGPDARPWSELSKAVAALQDTEVISYYPTRRRLVIWIANKERLRMKKVPVGREALARAVARFREELTSFHPVGALSRKLYRWLLSPFISPSSPPRLVIIPAGPLHVLPFAALHDGRKPVVARRVLSYLPSVNALLRLPAGQRGQGRSISFGWAGSGPRPLSFTFRETAALARTFEGAQVIQGQDATRERFQQEAPGASLLHLATHATYRPDAPLLSALELADGDLSMKDVLGMKLCASLVILSACDTGLGHLDGADGVLGLHRAFFASGARRVISSLWRVSDLGTALLMKRFFRRLRGASPALALQQAQNELRRRYPHPAFWAGFRLDGAP